MLPMVVSAQDLTQTFESAERGYSFQYPDGWFVNDNGDLGEALDVSNFDPRDEMSYDDVQPGEVIISISPFFIDAGFPLPSDATPDFVAGYSAGLFTFTLLLTSAMDDTSQVLTYGESATLDLENYDAAAVSYVVDDLYTGWLVALDGDKPFLVTIKSRVGELEQWLDIALAIVDSIKVQ